MDYILNFKKLKINWTAYFLFPCSRKTYKITGSISWIFNFWKGWHNFPPKPLDPGLFWSGVIFLNAFSSVVIGLFSCSASYWVSFDSFLKKSSPHFQEILVCLRIAKADTLLPVVFPDFGGPRIAILMGIVGLGLGWQIYLIGFFINFSLVSLLDKK